MSGSVAAKTLPANDEAERAVLGAVLLNNAVLASAAEVITATDFVNSKHRHIFASMVALAERSDAIDLVTLKEDLSRAGHLDYVGGPAYIAALADNAVRSDNVSHYAKVVREKAQLRALIFGAGQLLASAYEGEESAATILEHAERSIIGLADTTAGAGFEAMKTIAPRAMDFLERMCATRGGVSGVPTGFSELDAMTRGLQPGTLVVLGARPGVGKTSFAQNIAQNAAASGKVVGIFSLEMANDELFIRQIAAVAGIDSHRLNSGFATTEREWARISEAIGVITERPIFSDETPGIGVFQVRSRARRLKTEHGLDLIIIDYLQLMDLGDDRDTQALRIGETTKALKNFAKEIRVPVLLLSQLSREHEKQDRRPRLSDLRDSGSIEQDADIVMFLYRKDDPETVGSGTLTELILAKHRNGDVGTIRLVWQKQYTRLQDFEQAADHRLPVGDR